MSAFLTARTMLEGYARGIFPMAMSASDPQLHWFEPTMRGILPVGGVHVSRSMRRLLRHSDWRAGINGAFSQVIDGCADRQDTWINSELRSLYGELFRLGHTHSLEVFAGGRLIGGVFGLSLGRAFFAESMFSRADNASKAALIWMSAHLARCGFTLWDTQYPSPHLASMGGQTVARPQYRTLLKLALRGHADFTGHALPDPQALLHEITQTS
ncbi:leucyl/phenylalanyl-tRNA--protein transferase [Paracoccus halophilus]|uniref:Leucyl/phenylalanyl-tRNA--protein transferase n=1 Tax=Paracoccus halophilus TaxID=376733 RepID=A0A099F7K2_9RHOB|nr:leucyl/phenylalanyl-tRNA--protein transferase [Paracoccus halophilus]KGJ06246.1 leucyl/phenylalanyl-tRNA--protein transferase [Paracoccus halophilus]SFA45514.1 leucyl/phenylalanyl-tRNA--protein transferase [Paracoccus halophilus]